MSAIEHLEFIDNSIKELKAQRALLLEQAKKRRKTRHGIPEVDTGCQNTALRPLHCTPGTIDSNLLQSDTWEVILKGLATHASCKAIQICVIYSAQGKRGGQAVETVAFKHRFNKKFNALMREMKEQGIANPRFVPKTKTWTVERTDGAIDMLESNLASYFQHIIDVQSATLFTSTIWGQENKVASPPIFTSEDGIGKVQLLNELVDFIYCEQPTTIEEIHHKFISMLTEDDSSLFSERLKHFLPEFALAVAQKASTGPESSALKKWILRKYSLLVDKVNDELFNS